MPAPKAAMGPIGVTLRAPMPTSFARPPGVTFLSTWFSLLALPVVMILTFCLMVGPTLRGRDSSGGSHHVPGPRRVARGHHVLGDQRLAAHDARHLHAARPHDARGARPRRFQSGKPGFESPHLRGELRRRAALGRLFLSSFGSHGYATARYAAITSRAAKRSRRSIISVTVWMYRVPTVIPIARAPAAACWAAAPSCPPAFRIDR